MVQDRRLSMYCPSYFQSSKMWPKIYLWEHLNNIPAHIKHIDNIIKGRVQELPFEDRPYYSLLKNYWTKNNQANIDKHGKKLL